MSRIASTAIDHFSGALRRAIRSLERRTPAESGARALLPDGGRPDDSDDEHLRDVPDGAGCTEIWEHLSERQAAEVEGDD